MTPHKILDGIFPGLKLALMSSATVLFPVSNGVHALGDREGRLGLLGDRIGDPKGLRAGQGHGLVPRLS